MLCLTSSSNTRSKGKGSQGFISIRRAVLMGFLESLEMSPLEMENPELCCLWGRMEVASMGLAAHGF
jgi:hypothetical protein